jgi:integrase
MAIKVKLREKKISGNRQSLYLDFYPAIPHPKTGEPTRREFLGLYLFDKAKNPTDKQHNKETLQLAEQIRQKRENHLNKPEIYTGYEKEKLKIKEQGEQNFVTYFKSLAEKRKGSNHDNWVSAYNYFESFTKGNLKFADLNEKICNEFKEYLLTIKSKKSSKKSLSQNSADSYFNKMKATLKQAYIDGCLSADLNVRIKCIKTEEVIKQTLTVEELSLLEIAECKTPFLKKIVLFAATTGLPFMEMYNLRWEQIEISSSFGVRIKTTRQKSGKPYIVNIPEDAYKLLGKPQEPNKKVFDGLNDRLRYHFFPLWLLESGIKKHMTFHDLRHTYGCLQIELGTDPYTLQGQMAHSTPRQSMHYGKISDLRKREAAEKIKLNNFLKTK